MKTFVFTVSLATALASPALAATSIDFQAATVGTTFTINFNGQVGNGPPALYPDLSATATIRLVSIDNVNHAYNFAFAIDNTSTAFTTSRVSVFGFDVITPTGSPTASGFNANTIFDRTGSGTMASLGNREVCFRAGGGGDGCSGGGGGGVEIAGGYSPGQLFTLAFASTPLTVQLDNFGIRYQSISGIRGVESAVGIGTIASGDAVPEPATWAMLIVGFGMVGTAARRRNAFAAS